MAFYACSESGILGVETPETLRVLQECYHNIKLRENLFHSSYLPSLVAIDQQNKIVEVVRNEIILTTYQPIPLVRYNLHDKGMLLRRTDINKVLKKFGKQELFLNDSDEYLCIFGRTAVHEGWLLTPEDIRLGIEKCDRYDALNGYFMYKERKEDTRYVIHIIFHTRDKMPIQKKQKAELMKKLHIYIKTIAMVRANEQKLTTALKLDITYLSEKNNKKKYKSGKVNYFLD